MRRQKASDFVRSVGSDDVFNWLGLVRAEYCEMPGLSLTEAQVERLWQIDSASTRRLLADLQGSGFLRRTAKGTFVRADTVGA